MHGTFDFSALNESMADIKRGLWEVKRRESSFKRCLNMNHTDFANKIILRKKEESFNSYAEKLQHERDSMSSPRKIEKDAISRERSGTRSLTSLFGVKS